jgi:Fe2+ transport system protein FeoA
VANWTPLTSMAAGEAVIIRRIHELAEETHGLLAFLEEKGVMPGQPATVVEVLPFNQTITLRLENGEATLGFAAARYIFVEPA